VPEPSESDGPSDHAVRLARAWVFFAGCAWLVLGLGLVVASGMGLGLATFVVLLVAAVHFLVARFASRRVAVFFAMFGP
jgi:hypothetical protein